MGYSKSENAFISRWAKKRRLLNLLGGKCEMCGTDNIFQLDFHHKRDKEYTINQLINKGYRWSRVWEEGKKCSILCRNCHMELHSSKGSRQEKAKKKVLKEKLCCEKCGYVGKNLSSLDFHHVDPESKIFTISDFLSRKISVNLEALENEIEKCEILCKNCHILESVDIDKYLKFESEIERRVSAHKERPVVDRDKIIDLYKRGLRQKEITKEIGCAKSTVSLTIKNFNTEH
jgi:hypothetical protein